MINTQVFEQLIRLCIVTPFIAQEKPVSIILVAPAEHGKTEILKKFALVESVKLMTNFDTPAFASFVLEYQGQGKKTIIIPDFLRVVNRKQSTQSSSLTIINALTEEGWYGDLPMGQHIGKNERIMANILTAITQDEILDKRHKWTSIGFLSRFLPVSFTYLEETKEQVRGYIRNRMYQVDEPFNDIQKYDKKISIGLTSEVAKDIETISKDLMLKISSVNLTGFRIQRQLQTLALANAVLSRRNITNDDDTKTILQISKFINFQFNKI